MTPTQEELVRHLIGMNTPDISGWDRVRDDISLKDLGYDSLDLAQLSMDISDQTGVDDPRLNAAMTVLDVVNEVAKMARRGEGA